MHIWVHFIFIPLVLVVFIFCIRTKKLNYKSSAILIVISSVSTFQITTYFMDIMKIEEQPENTQATPQAVSSESESCEKHEETEKPPLLWDFDLKYRYDSKTGQIILPQAWEFYQKYYDEKEVRTPPSSWDFDENDKKRIQQLFGMWTAWFEVFFPKDHPHVKYILQLIEDQEMTVPLFCINISELYIITDKLRDRAEKLKKGYTVWSKEEPKILNQFLDQPNYIKTCKILQRTEAEGKYWFEFEEREVSGTLQLYDVTSKYMCKRFFEYKNSVNQS